MTAAAPVERPAVGREAGTSLFRDAMRRLRRNRLAVVGGIVVATLFLASIVVPVFMVHVVGYSPTETDPAAAFQSPSWRHPFGTDELGRDLLTRVFYGGRISFAVGIVATVVAVVIGVSWGAVAGYFGGRVDNAMMRAVDVMYGLPFMFLVILLMTVVQDRGVVYLFIALGAIQWLTMSRIVRGQMISLREADFVQAARVLGASNARIIARHIVPNLLGPVIVYATLTVPAVMLEEAFLSYLGLGVQAPNTSWGMLVADGVKVVTPLVSFWWVILWPALFLAATLFGLNSLGDGLRDALDPKTRR